MPALAATAAFAALAGGHVPRAVAVTVTLTGMAVAVTGFLLTVVSLPVLMIRHHEMFNGRQSAVLRAFARDLVSRRRPAPPPEPAWPPPMRRP